MRSSIDVSSVIEGVHFFEDKRWRAVFDKSARIIQTYSVTHSS